ncbi:RbsD/FucU family protein [Arboricoccus pini]|nr:RbsD/FucU domain-containing protein [Arboricoccus pini]
MLKSIHPLIGPELLHALAAMGHGDEIVLVDANFPATSVASETVLGQPLRLDGVDVVEAARIVLSLLPLDAFVDDPAVVMQVVGDATAVPEVVALLQKIVEEAHGQALPLKAIERFDFYARAKQAFAVVATSERRLYGNIILKKGVIPPP